MPDRDLIGAGNWCAKDPARFARFREASDRARYRRGEGSIGRIASGGVSVWVRDIGADLEPERGDPGREAGLVAAYFVPVMVDHQSVAVIEFYADNSMDIDPDLAKVIEQIRKQFGRTFERMLTHDALRAAKEQAEAANRAKSEFLAIASHELRTPLNGVLGLSQVLKTTELSPAQLDMVETIHRSGDMLLNIVSIILDYTAVESGDPQLANVAFCPAEVARGVVAEISAMTREKGVEASYLESSHLPPRFTGDPERLRQVLLNLAANAAKFTDRGSITVYATVENMEEPARNDETLTARFEVIDTGVGMTEDEIRRVFDRFTQADTSLSRPREGLGLGLALAHRLCELMHGQMGVESAPGMGSRF